MTLLRALRAVSGRSSLPGGLPRCLCRGVDFTLSDRSHELQERLAAFMDECVYPAEAVYARGRATSLDPHHIPPVVEELKVEARSRGLWNLFLPGVSGLSNVEYAPLAELMGRSPVSPRACNCSAPDTGNMELLHMFGTGSRNGSGSTRCLRARSARASR